jgi:uncharacterized protein (DUF2336 family)
MTNTEVNALIDDKDEDARVQIATRVGECLSSEDLAQVDRRAAEILARELVQDAIVRVRQALCMAVRHARELPRDIALTIAHDIDSIACPFLAVTEIFSDEDLLQLLLTVSRGARATIAERSPMGEGLAQNLSGVGDAVVAGTLIGNPAAPMTEPVCKNLLDRFETDAEVLDKLALREDLITDIAIKLTARVSDAARDKLCRTYDIPGSVPGTLEPVVEEAAVGAIIELLKTTADDDLMIVVQTLKADGKLTPAVLLKALQAGHMTFLEVGLEVLSGRTAAHVRSVIRRADENAVGQLLGRAFIPATLHTEFWNAVHAARRAA